MHVVNMAFSDERVLGALARLLEQRGQEALLTQDDVSAAARVSRATAQRALYRLQVAGLIAFERGKGSSKTYKICVDERIG